jgi:hypothetical protein
MKILVEKGENPRPKDRALISVLSCFRALSPPRWVPNFGTLTDPFIGQKETFREEAIKLALESMGATSFFSKRKLCKPIFF